jgi:hypothetical protein
MFVYIEYISRLPDVSLDTFRRTAITAQEGWEGAHAGDRLLLHIARTWRIGPEPEYLAVWLHASHGLQHLDEWEALYAGGQWAVWNEPFRLAGRMDAAGCYEPLLEPSTRSSGRYYAEYFNFASGASRDDVRDYFTDRASRHPEIELKLLIDRIGTLGPNPRALAFWNVSAFERLGDVVRELDRQSGPLCDITGALYADLGSEIA